MAINDWEIEQIDFIGAFLNGDLKEDIYMEICNGPRPESYSRPLAGIYPWLEPPSFLVNSGQPWLDSFPSFPSFPSLIDRLSSFGIICLQVTRPVILRLIHSFDSFHSLFPLFNSPAGIGQYIEALSLVKIA